MIKLSIIIPYYNTYEYTIKLLKELQIQKTDEVEVILIDDGCNETRFDVFSEFIIEHKEHLGACAAWNAGIARATGEYIAFIDSDDMITMDYVDSLLTAIEKSGKDEIRFGWIDSTTQRAFVVPSNRAIWKAIYRKEIVPQFDEKLLCNTDAQFQKDLWKTPHSVFRLHKFLYFYNSNREGSITWRKRRGEIK